MRWEITVASCKQGEKKRKLTLDLLLKAALLILHSVFFLPPKLLWIQNKIIKSSSLKAEGTSDSSEPNPHGKEIKGQLE